MTAAKYSPALILSIAGIVLVILFMAVAASGFSVSSQAVFIIRTKMKTGFMFSTEFLRNLTTGLFLKTGIKSCP